MVSEIFKAERWRRIDRFDFADITYHRAVDQGTVRIAFNRPEVRNAFRPRTVYELYTALEHARTTADVGCVLITGSGPSQKDGGWAFCSDGDQRIRGYDGNKYEGDSLHVVCDMTLASREHAMFKQTDPDVASFDSGYGSALLARQVGQKKAREIFFLGLDYTAEQAAAMGMVNAVVAHAELEEEALRWGAIINSKSPTADRKSVV